MHVIYFPRNQSDGLISIVLLLLSLHCYCHFAARRISSNIKGLTLDLSRAEDVSEL